MKIEIIVNITDPTKPPSIKLTADTVTEEATLASIIQLSDGGDVPATSYCLNSKEANGTSVSSITFSKS